MDRLTRKDKCKLSHGEEIIICNHDKQDCNDSCMRIKPCKWYKKVQEKLWEYENAEEQGLLLRLPCNIGDTIYEVSYENREFVIKEHIVKEFIYMTYRFPRIEIYCENENGFLVCNNIGKLDECLFLTQAEAEQKLKEMENR